jgi:CHAT domain-containing protein
VRTSFSVKSLVCPNATTVLDQLKECDMVHFACHGVSNFANPSESCLRLQKCGESHFTPEPDSLTVRQVSETHLRHAKIAYLSACSTAENRTVPLADEVIHLASGFQVAGFGHVIGSLWPSNDSICVDVAKCFYKQLTPGCQGAENCVAAALHESVMQVRSQLRRQPLSWAQYVHFGA